MLLNDSHFPIAILLILPKQRKERTARLVPTPNTRRLPDFSSRAGEPEVEFVVLIADEFFVKKTNPIKNLARPAAEIHCVNNAFVARIMSSCSSNRERGVKSRGNCLPNKSLSISDPWTTDIVSIGFTE